MGNKKRRSRSAEPPWEPLQPATLPDGELSDLVAKDPGYVGVFMNRWYQVTVKDYDGGFGKCMWLSIVRRDRKAIHDWRHLQKIKNDIAGPEREAIEVYPAESRLVDTNNQYHLFVLPQGMQVPVGYLDRDVGDEKVGSHRQRPFADKPSDFNARRGQRRNRVYGPPKDTSSDDHCTSCGTRLFDDDLVDDTGVCAVCRSEEPK